MTTAALPSSALRILCRTTAAVALLAALPLSGVRAEVMPTQASAPLAPRANDPAWARADALVKQMTLDEKIQYLHGLFPPNTKPAPADMIHLGRLRAGRTTAEDPDPARERRQPGRGQRKVEQRKGDVAHGPAFGPVPGLDLRAVAGTMPAGR
ncbi:hypothetical protein ACRAWD_00670 [Caulobacter segnis]